MGCASHEPHPVAAGKTAVGQIEVKGASSIDTDDLVDGLGLTHARSEGQPFERYLVALDRRRIRGYYARRGFFGVELAAAVDRTPREAGVTFTITEGARARLARVEISGIPADSSITVGQLRALIPLADGAPYDHAAWELARANVVTAFEEAGYAHVQVHDTVFADRVRLLAVIRISIEAGPRTRFGTVSLSGIDGDLARAVRARLSVREGGWFSPSEIAASRLSLYEMGRFSMVRIEPEVGSRNELVVPISIEVVQAKRHELRLGAGVGMNPAFYEVRGRAGYSVAAWPTALNTSRLELRPAIVRLRDEPKTNPRLEALAAIERLDLFRPRMRGAIEVGFDYLSLEAYTSVGPRLRVGLRTPLYGRHVQVAAGWQLRALRFRDLNPALDPALIDELGLRGNYVLGFYDQSLIVDLRDDPVRPRIGVYGELQLEEGTPAAAGELTYVKVVPEVRGYLPIGGAVLATRARLGDVIGDVPVTQRFYAGGANSQRGFSERRLGPFASREVDGVTKTVVYGGGALVEVGAELRIPLGTIRGLEVGSALFLDGADVRERLAELDLFHPHWATGLGLRIATPVGPFRIDVGYRLNRFGAGEPSPGSRLAFHVSLGEAF